MDALNLPPTVGESDSLSLINKGNILLRSSISLVWYCWRTINIKTINQLLKIKTINFYTKLTTLKITGDFKTKTSFME